MHLLPRRPMLPPTLSTPSWLSFPPWTFSTQACRRAIVGTYPTHRAPILEQPRQGRPWDTMGMLWWSQQPSIFPTFKVRHEYHLLLDREDVDGALQTFWCDQVRSGNVCNFGASLCYVTGSGFSSFCIAAGCCQSSVESNAILMDIQYVITGYYFPVSFLGIHRLCACLEFGICAQESSTWGSHR